MPTIAEMVVKVEVPDFPPDEWLISEDGVPLESDWHAVEIDLLRDLVHQHFFGRSDFFAGGNMFIYFNEEQARNKDYRGPDFFFVWGVSPMPLRPYWAVWKEGGRYPNMIVELLSPSTATEDRTTKKDIYERVFRTPEYYCYDPDAHALEGWRLSSGRYEQILPNDRGWLWSEQLQVWLGPWNGSYLNRQTTWLRLYAPDGSIVPTREEAAEQGIAQAEDEAALAQQQVSAARQQATAAQKQAAMAQEQADQAKHQAATALSHAEEQRRRAEALEAELARLKANLQPKKD